jgi:branched-chain amino acid transport system ATP-binding protein
MLSIKGLHSGYGNIEVLHGIDLEVEEGAIAAVIGANGAGKTTLLMAICGHLRARAGEILFEGEDIARIESFAAIRRGIAHVPEGRRIFSRMSVMENLQLGAYAAPKANFAADLDLVLSLFPQLKDRLEQSGGTLSGGEQQMLSLGRALMSRPKLLLLDEPSLGLAPIVVRHVFDIIRDVNAERGTTVLLIEQNAFQALRLAGPAYVMVNGRIARSGTGLELLRDPAVQAAYLDGGLGMSVQEPAS